MEKEDNKRVSLFENFEESDDANVTNDVNADNALNFSDNVNINQEQDKVVIEENVLDDTLEKLNDNNSISLFKELEKQHNQTEDIEDFDNHDTENNDKSGEQKYNKDNLKSKSLEELVEIYLKYVSKDYNPDEKKIISDIKIIITDKFKEEYNLALEKFIKEGGNAKDFVYDNLNLEQKFNQASQTYKEKRQKYLEEHETQKKHNLEVKLKMLESLKDLVNSDEPLKKIYDEFNILVAKWNEIGPVPRSEANNLWQNYHYYIEKFYEKVKINKELRDLDLRKNLERKIELCEKVEALLLEKSINKSFKLLQQYHEEWKGIGPVPSDRKDEIWERFKIATEKINERRRDYYIQFNEQQQKNYEAKRAICEKVEEILSSELNTFENYKQKTNEINEMMNLWKTIGSAPKKKNDEIWQRFKTLVNTFFENKKEFLDNLKDKQTENYNQKLQICVQAEALKNSTDWKKTTQEFIHLQNEWKKIGPIPKKQADKLWRRFRSACDEFFNNKAKYFANIENIENENLKLKQELIKKIEDYQFSENKNENLEALKNFQRQWLEIGRVPIKYKNEIQEAFRNAINKQFDKLKVNSVEASTIEFKTKIEQLKNKPGSERVLSQEKNTLQSKLIRLKNDISLWENNLGFLVNSKNADLLKEEFYKKIEKAKQEVLILEAKIKLLDNQIKQQSK
ncbi:MAG TPA: DUF349 domain-containing protein [Bacteroidales bacterium]|nr:DUF349 domain-containing protein [Bacteroidales bacterium]